jgi:hypothetical protein
MISNPRFFSQKHRLRNYLLLTWIAIAVASTPAFAQRYTVLPQFATGDGWSSDIFFANQGTALVNGIVVSLYGESGAPLTVGCNLGTASSFTLNLKPGATQVLRTASTGAIQVGYVVIKFPSLAPVLVSEIFRYEQGGAVLAELGVPQLYPFNHFSFPVEVSSSRGVNTGVALANPALDSGSGAAQTILVNLIRDDGTLQQTAQVILGPGEHRSVYVNESLLFSGLDNFVGTISLSGASPFGVVALRQDKQAFGAVATETGPVLGPFTVNTAAVPETKPNNSPAQAQILSGNSLISGNIETAGEVDYYSFTGRRGDVISAIVDTQGLNSQLDSVIRLEDSDGTLVSENDQNGLLAQNDSFLQAVLPEDGIYYLSVFDYFNGGGADFAYRLHVRVSGGGQPPPPAKPQINSLTPTSAARGSTNTLVVQGTNLGGTTSVNITPAQGVTISSIQSTAAQVTAQLSIAADAQLGERQVSVTTAAGTSNALSVNVTQAAAPGVIVTPIGNLVISKVEIPDTFPPGCASSDPFCVRAEAGYEILVVWLAGSPENTIDPSSIASYLIGVFETVSVQASNGHTTTAFSAGLQSGGPFVAFTPPVADSGFKLLWPGNAAIDLGK